MTRKQITIPGTERRDHPEIETCALSLGDLDEQFADISRKKAQTKMELGVLMKLAKVRKYKYFDPKRGRHRVAKVEDGVEKISIEDTDEVVQEVGTGVSSGEPAPGIRKGLIDQAMNDGQDAEANVTIDDWGDVGVPDKAAPKTKRKAKKK